MSRGLPSPFQAATGIAITVVVVLWAPTPVRVPFAIGFALVVPGYLVMRSVFASTTLGRAERVLLSLALSISVVIIIALFLNFTVGLRSTTWALGLAAFEGLAYLVARGRRVSAGAKQAAPPRLRVSTRDTVFVVVALALVSVAAAVALRPLSATHVDGYTALSIVPTANGKGLRIGVRSAELRTLSYRLVVEREGRPLLNRLLRAVAPGTLVTTAVDVPRGGGAISAVLYRTDRPKAPYRSVMIRVPPPQ